MNQPFVSIIMPAFNAERNIAAAIESVLAQTLSEWELLIVDDGSRDQTCVIAAWYAAAHHDRIFVFHHDSHSNRGVAASRNLAITRARGEYMAFLDADDLWRPQKLSQQIAFMDARPDLALTYTGARIIRESQGDLFMPGVQEYGSDLPSDPELGFMAIAMGRAHYAFSSVLAKRAAVLEAGRFDCNLRFQNDDRLLVAKVAARHCIALCPGILCDYRVHAAGYSSGVALQKMAPLLFLDVQLRLLCWLRRQPAGGVLESTLAKCILQDEALDGIISAIADPSLRISSWKLLAKCLLTDPPRGLHAVMRVLFAIAGVRPVVDRERSSEELAAGCRKVMRMLDHDRIKRVVLYGAGQHTQRLLQGQHLSACEIIGVVDDHAERAEIMGIPVCHPEAFDMRDSFATIISSDTLESKLLVKARQHGLRPVYCLYS
jgi:hypothetical protein